MVQTSKQLQAFYVFRLRSLWHLAALVRNGHRRELIQRTIDQELHANGVETCDAREIRRRESFREVEQGKITWEEHDKRFPQANKFGRHVRAKASNR